MAARSIRARLMALLAVPTIALVALSTFGVVTQAGNAADAERVEASVALVLGTQGLVHELQRERGLTNGLLAGEGSFRGPLDDERARVNAARADLERLLGSTESVAADRVRLALGRLGGLGDLRAQADATAVDRARALDFYTSAIDELSTASTVGQQEVADADLLSDLDALRALGDAKEATALERGFLNGVFTAGSFSGREYVTFTETRATKLAGFAAFGARAEVGPQAALDAALRSPSATAARDMEQRALDGAAAAALNVSPRPWWDAMTTVVNDLRAVQQQVGADAAARAAALRTQAVTVLLLYIALTVAALVGAAVLAAVAARSITRPLQLLATDAREAATVRLPQTVARIQSDPDADGSSVLPDGGAAATLATRQDEIADVARALLQVQHTAVELAGAQAVLRRNTAESMASLARRNQNLLRRQLGFISELERDETDSAALGNLFELDHLATRMRRNAESLLVLIGERGPRRWSEPVALSDVIRAALSEVEEYRRVSLRRLDDALVIGAAGAELAHLVAELVENALSFSPPDRDVEIYGQPASDGSYTVAVVDYGIGMSADDLARANARLSGTETFLVAPTRYLGHYVVGRLAQRLGVDVTLHESPLSGITARVTLPPSLLSAEVPDASPVPSAPPAEAAAPVDRGSRPAPERATRAAPVAVLDPPQQRPGAADPTRTRNGLAKRVRGTSSAAAASRLAAPAASAVPDSRRSPEASRTSITSLRAGFERRSQERDRDRVDERDSRSGQE